jgi:O-antigen ligase
MTSVAWYHFTNHPFVGNGLNSFNDLVGKTFLYSVEFGDPLESHGFMQKLLSETGLLGFLGFVVLLLKIFKDLLHAYLNSFGTNKLMILLLIMMSCGAVFFQLFSTSYFLSQMWLPLGVSLAGIKLYQN